MGLHHLLREPQHEEQGLLRDRDAAALGHEGDRDAAGARRLEFDAIAPAGPELDQSERGPGRIHDLARHRDPPGDDGHCASERRFRRSARGVRRHEVYPGTELPDEREVVRAGWVEEDGLHDPAPTSSSCVRSQALT